MTIATISPNHYEIQSSQSTPLCVLSYGGKHDLEVSFWGVASGSIAYQKQRWVVMPQQHQAQPLASITINHHASMYLQLLDTRQQFLFKRMGFWKTRFALLLANDHEEVVALIPKVNWHKGGYDFTVQVNEDFKGVITPLLMVVCLHCANCSLKIMNGDYPFYTLPSP